MTLRQLCLRSRFDRLSGQDRAGSAARRGVPFVRKGNLPIDYSSYKRYGVRRVFVFNLAS